MSLPSMCETGLMQVMPICKQLYTISSTRQDTYVQLGAAEIERDIPRNSILGPRDAQSRRLTSIHVARFHMIACSGNHLG